MAPTKAIPHCQPDLSKTQLLLEFCEAVNVGLHGFENTVLVHHLICHIINSILKRCIGSNNIDWSTRCSCQNPCLPWRFVLWESRQAAIGFFSLRSLGSACILRRIRANSKNSGSIGATCPNAYCRGLGAMQLEFVPCNEAHKPGAANSAPS